MGSNSSKNLNFSQEVVKPSDAVHVEEHTNISEDIVITPLKKSIPEELEDPRSPTIKHRTPLSSPAPVRSWRAIAAAHKDMDPRSPSMHSRTPTLKSVPSRVKEAFDPRSPSLLRTPFGGLSSSEEVVFGSVEPTSPYVAGHSLCMSVNMEPVPTDENPEQGKKSETEQQQQPEQEPEAHVASPSSENSDRKDGASLMDSNMSLTNSDNNFQPMQSVEITKPEVSDDKIMRKRKKDGKNESLCASPLKRSYTSLPVDSENIEVL